MPELPYMQLYVAKYLADTMHLTTLQHGAYMLLLMNYWQRGKALQNDDSRLANIVKMSAKEWKANRGVLAEFFTVTEAEWVHGRVERDLERVTVTLGKRSAAGKESANKRSTNAQHMLNTCSPGVSANAQQNTNNKEKEEKNNKEEKGGEVEAPPFPASDIPAGLPVLAYARGLLDHCNIPIIFATQQAVAAAISAYAREMSIPKHLATQGLIELARDALARDEPVDKWWFTDRKWIRKKGNNGHFTTKADITLNAARELIDEIRGAAGGVEDQGADVPGDSTAGGCIEGNPQAVRR